MEIIIKIVIGIVALFHLYVMWLEMFAWTTKGPKTFKNFEKELFPKTKSLAANQGLYNGFLAAGLIWTFFICNPEWRFNVSLFFLICVSVAGIYGALTADKKIFFVQALPALVGIILLVFTTGMNDVIQKKENFQFYTFSWRNPSDTIWLESIYKHNENDTLLYSHSFKSGKKTNYIDIYCSIQPAIDEPIRYELRGLGIIYSEGLVKNYISSTNDSINKIIDAGLKEILIKESFLSSKIFPQEKTIQFIEPGN